MRGPRHHLGESMGPRKSRGRACMSPAGPLSKGREGEGSSQCFPEPRPAPPLPPPPPRLSLPVAHLVTGTWLQLSVETPVSSESDLCPLTCWWQKPDSTAHQTGPLDRYSSPRAGLRDSTALPSRGLLAGPPLPPAYPVPCPTQLPVLCFFLGAPIECHLLFCSPTNSTLPCISLPGLQP